MLLCWAGMALAVLAKGLIGLVLPGAVLVLYAAVARLRHLEAPAPGQGPAAVLRHRHAVVRAGRPAIPEQPHFFFVHEHWERFFLKTHHREGAWYYFLVLLVPGILPWLGAPQALAGRRRAEPASSPSCC
jgi:4-amino-4-deoxy-L-arabinose transferase-like glycosyltransferase